MFGFSHALVRRPPGSVWHSTAVSRAPIQRRPAIAARGAMGKDSAYQAGPSPAGRRGHEFAAIDVLSSRASRLPGTGELIQREEPARGKDPHEEDGEVVELTTGGSSKCNLGGDAQSITNNNDECSRPCTQEHEENHVARRAPCCERARAAYHAARDAGDSERRSRVMRLWNEWTRANNAASECEAYGVSIACANRMHSERDCDNTESECCTQIASYRSHVTERREHYCGLSGDSTARTECPDFS